MINNICIIDTETTGLDHKKDSILEVAAIYYNIQSKNVMQQLSTLFCAEKNDAEHVNKISKLALKNVNTHLNDCLILHMLQMLEHCDAIVAHNAEFDKSFLELIPLIGNNIKNKKWICTKNDFKWPIPKLSSLSLINISLEMGVPVFSSHRALTDCQLLASCFSKLDDLESRFVDASKERKIYFARLSFEQRQLAKDNGFSWDSNKRAWFKYLTDDELNDLPFNVSIF